MSSRIFFTSDNHFWHKAIMRFCPDTRLGIQDVDSMNQKMVEIWNSNVSLKDEVFCLGDFSFGSATKTESILQQLNGRIHLIKGNHDHWINKDTEKYFESIQPYHEMKIDGQFVVMFHYPIAEWNRMHHGAFHLYGHVHGGLKLHGRAMDVGIDARPQKDMGLWSWEEIVEQLKDREIVPHHGKVQE